MKLSIIVCTRNRAHGVAVCLNSIAASLAYAGNPDAELVVVDNGSTDETAVQLKNWAATGKMPLQILTEPRRGLSRARNYGIRNAKGDLLAFIDDDCRPTLTYVEELLRHDAADSEPVLRGGAVLLGDPSDLPLTVTRHTQPKRWHIRDDVTRRENPGNAILGCNIAMRRTVLDRIGLYDEKLGPGTPLHAGEDPDMVFRAYLAGIPIAFETDMAVTHHHGRKSTAEGRQLFKNYCLGGGAVYAKYLFRHPDFCRQYYWDLKNSVREIRSGKNTFMPSVDFSHKDKILYSTAGAALYAWAALASAGRP